MGKSNILIRPIGLSDRRDFLTLSEKFYDTLAVCHPIPLSYHEETFSELMRSKQYAEAFILESAGRIIGYGLIAKTYSREAGGKVLWLEELFLLEEYRGQGAGKQYFEWIEEYARKQGYARIRLEVSPENPRAEALYEKLGYHRLQYRQMSKQVRKDGGE